MYKFPEAPIDLLPSDKWDYQVADVLYKLLYEVVVVYQIKDTNI